MTIFFINIYSLRTYLLILKERNWQAVFELELILNNKTNCLWTSEGAIQKI